MDITEPRVHSFIVKLWLEEAGDETKSAGWHGHITHVPSGARRYLQGLGDILGFIEPYMGRIEADSKPSVNAKGWLRPWRRRKQ